MKLNFAKTGKTTSEILSVFDHLVDQLNNRITELIQKESDNNQAINELANSNMEISKECTQASKAIARIQQITSKE